MQNMLLTKILFKNWGIYTTTLRSHWSRVTWGLLISGHIRLASHPDSWTWEKERKGPRDKDAATGRYLERREKVYRWGHDSIYYIILLSKWLSWLWTIWEFILSSHIKELSYPTNENKCPPASAPYDSELRWDPALRIWKRLQHKQTKAFLRGSRNMQPPRILQSLSKASKTSIKINWWRLCLKWTVINHRSNGWE